MNPTDAARIANSLCALFPCKPDTPEAYALAIEGYDATLMEMAVAKASEAHDRLPSVRQLIALYRQAEAAASAPADANDPPCSTCAAEGVVKSSIPPFTGRQRYTDDDGKDLGLVWPHPPACFRHSRERAMAEPTQRRYFMGDDNQFVIGMSMRLPGINPPSAAEIARYEALTGKEWTGPWTRQAPRPPAPQ